MHCRTCITSISLIFNALDCIPYRCFLAVKHGSAAMLKTNPSRGKEASGGSIIMTASSKCIVISSSVPIKLNDLYQAAGIRSGAGTVDCELHTPSPFLLLTLTCSACRQC